MHVYALTLVASFFVITLAVAAGPSATSTQQLVKNENWVAVLELVQSDELALSASDAVLKDYVRSLFETKQRVRAVKLLNRKAEMDRGLNRDRSKHWAAQWAKILASQFYTVAGSQGFQDGYALWRNQYPTRGPRMREAVDRIEKALSTENDHFDSLLRLGEAYLYLGQAATALERLTRARALDPTGGGELSLFLGSAQCLQGKPDLIESGLAELRRAIHDLGVHELAFAYFSQCLGIAGRLPEATQFAQKTIRANPQFYRVLLQLGELRLLEWKEEFEEKDAAELKLLTERGLATLAARLDSDPDLVTGLRRILAELNLQIDQAKKRSEEHP